MARQLLTDDQREANRKASQKKYKQSPQGRKKYRTDKWISRGLKFREGETLVDIYTRYMETDICECCECILTQGERYNSKTTKVMDHDHQTGFCRAIVCHSCNVSDRVKHSEAKNLIDLMRVLVLGVSWTCLILFLSRREPLTEDP